MPRRHPMSSAVAVAVWVGAAWTSPALAQHYEYDPLAGRPAKVFAQGGAYSPLTHLDPSGDVDFKVGFAFGGGVGYHLGRHVALRGSFNFTRAELRDPAFGSTIAGIRFNRYLYDADVQLLYPLRGPATPYAFVGIGGVTVQRDTVRTRASFTKGAGKAGLGLSYELRESPASAYLEATAWIYQWDRYGFDNTQVDATVSAGLSYRFKL
jgi:opacity protein-like surface antigen